MSLRTRASTFAGRTPDLVVNVASGDSAGAHISVSDVRLNDVVVGVINLSDGTSQTVKSVGHEKIVLEEDTSDDTLVVLFWSVGLGGSPSSS